MRNGIQPNGFEIRHGSNQLVTRRGSLVHHHRTQISNRNPDIYQRVSCIHSQGSRCLETDVCIIGAGIIGLSVSHRLLERGLTCTIVDAKVPCYGATGAGQGYIWMAHRDPLSTGAWKMAKASKAMWERQMVTQSESSFGVACEWNRNGSLLVSTTFEESESLRNRVQLLQDAGMEAAYLDHRQLKQKEACLCGSSIQGGVLTPSDGQINGRKTAEALLSSCRSFRDTFEAIFHDGCNSALVDHTTGQPRIYGVELSSGLLIHATKGVVVACGAWTGGLLDTLLGEINSGQTRPSWKDTIIPSRGHLLVLSPDEKSPHLCHGVMESTYTKHYDRSTDTPSQEIDITFTATRNHIDGTVLLGSSREVGQPLQHHQRTNNEESIKWDNTPDDGIVRRILERAYEFVPTIFGDNTITDIANDIVGQQRRHSARVGLRPYAFGRPLVGPIPEADGLYVAAGHEGSGLTLGPITAEIILHHISNTNDIDLEDILSYLTMNP